MVQEAIELARRIRQEAVRQKAQDFQKGTDLLEDFAHSLGKQDLLPQNLSATEKLKTSENPIRRSFPDLTDDLFDTSS